MASAAVDASRPKRLRAAIAPATINVDASRMMRCPTPKPGGGTGMAPTIPPIALTCPPPSALLASTLIVAGAMAARGLFGRLASTAALAISVLLVALTMWYYRLYVYSPVSAGYGLYVGAAAAVLAVMLSVWAMVAAWSAVSRLS